MRIKARAKINWALNVLGKRTDGYHDLDMLNQRLALADDIRFTVADEISLSVTGAGDRSVPDDQSNLVWRAAAALQARCAHPVGVHISLHKRIPSGAGLGGGSADAAAVLMGLNYLWDMGLSLQALRDIGLSLGADVPYCLAGGFARVGGIGEVIQPISHAPLAHLVMIQPKTSLSTKAVFAQLHTHPAAAAADIPRAAHQLISRDFMNLSLYAVNQLQGAAQTLCPEMAVALDDLKSAGALFAGMSGAGSVVFGAFDSAAQAKKAHDALKTKWETCLQTRTISG
ncbi:MAG: 4-(cytidine 5'-diphospho)-2-C-methyl-D-erythritol kinase [Christensenellales bacterium]|jgi:4-diphosphocytidyl-2-C-methyl-D-erythritol kinase